MTSKQNERLMLLICIGACVAKKIIWHIHSSRQASHIAKSVRIMRMIVRVWDFSMYHMWFYYLL